MADSTPGRRTKVLLALAGGAAALTMGGFSVAGDGGSLVTVPAAAPVLPGPMTEGDTVTTTIPPSVLAISKAKPVVKAKPYGK
ncbi:hypothetical protein ACXDF8_20545 [Mycolicibacterium sp. CBM1]